MMKRTLAILLLLMTPLAFAGELSITGPTEAVKPGEDTWLQVSSLTLDEIKAAKAENKIHFTVYPKLDAQLNASYDLLNDQPDDTLGLLFEAKYPADYLIQIDIYRNEKLEVASFVVIVDGEEPDPGPRPDPEPEPEPPKIATWAIIVEERSDRTSLPANQRLVFESKAIRELLPAGQFVLYDRHSTDPDGKSYIEQAKTMTMPVLFLVDKNGDVVFSGPLPATVDATVKLIGEHAGGGQ